MPQNVVGRLRTDLICNTGQFETGMRRASGSVMGFSAAVGKAGKLLAGFGTALMAGFSIRGMTSFVKTQFEAIDALGDMAKRLNIGTAALGGLQYAAKMSGADVQELNKGVQFMQKNVSAAASGTGDAAGAIASMGLEAKKLNAMRTEDKFAAIAEKLSQIPNEADRLKMALQIFGKGGGGLIPMLNEGAEGVRKMLAEFKRLGGAFSDLDVKKVQEADDAINRMKTALAAMGGKIAVAVSPGIEGYANKMGGGVGAVKAGLDVPAKLTGYWKTQRGLFTSEWAKATAELTAGGMSMNTRSGKESRDVLVLRRMEAWEREAMGTQASLAKIRNQFAGPGSVRPGVGMLAGMGGGLLGSIWRGGVNTLSNFGPKGGVGGIMDGVSSAASVVKKMGDELKKNRDEMKKETGKLFAESMSPMETYLAKMDTARKSGLSRGTIAKLDKKYRKEMTDDIYAKIPTNMEFAGGEQQGSAGAYATILRAIGSDRAKGIALDMQKQQLAEAKKSSRTLEQINAGLRGDEAVSLDNL